MNDTGKIQKALTKLMGEKPDSFLLAVRTNEETTVTIHGTVEECAINLLDLQVAVQELRGGRKWGK